MPLSFQINNVEKRSIEIERFPQWITIRFPNAVDYFRTHGSFLRTQHRISILKLSWMVYKDEKNSKNRRNIFKLIELVPILLIRYCQQQDLKEMDDYIPLKMPNIFTFSLTFDKTISNQYLILNEQNVLKLPFWGVIQL